MKIAFAIHTVLLFFWLPFDGRILGFLPPSTSHRGVCVVQIAPGVLSKPCRRVPLKYRELNEEDEMSESATLKVMSRAPPGYNLRENLQGQRNRMSRQKTGMNLPLIRALTLNQFLILGLATVLSAGFIFSTEGMSGFSNLNEILQWAGDTNIFDLEVTFERLLWGIGGALPLLAFSSLIENSDNRAFANINFSTITMVMTLFGRRTVPPNLPPAIKSQFPTTKTSDVLFQSFLLSTTTGFCEESVFRRLLPAQIALKLGTTNPIIPYLISSVIFGLGHVQPNNKPVENGVLLGLQTINGLGFGLIYLLTRGDLVACIIAHAAYDFVTFFNTWRTANDQIEYAQSMASKPLSPEIEKEARKAYPQIDASLFQSLKSLFYIFDFDKNESLSLSEVRKGIAYLNIDRSVPPPPQEAIDRAFESAIKARDYDGPPSRLTFPDFLRLVYMTTKKPKSQQAIKRGWKIPVPGF